MWLLTPDVRDWVPGLRPANVGADEPAMQERQCGAVTGQPLHRDPHRAHDEHPDAVVEQHHPPSTRELPEPASQNPLIRTARS